MKKIIALVLALLMLGTCLVSCNNTQPNDNATASSSLYVGYGRENITPAIDSGYTLAGYANVRDIVDIASEIFVSCTAFRDGEGDIALVYTLDLHAMNHTQATTLASAVTGATGVPSANMIFNVTHNHNAPKTEGEYFSDIVTPAVTKAAESAIADLKACTELYAGEINMKSYSFIRRYLKDDNGDPVEHEHDMDYMIPVAKFVRDGGKDVIMVNFAAHCDTVPLPKTSVSADYVAVFRKTVESQLDAHFSMQLGATGDVNPMTEIKGEISQYSNTDAYGRNLAYKIANDIEKLPKLEIKGDVEAITGTARVEVDHTTDALEEVARTIVTEYNDQRIMTENLMRENGIADVYEAIAILTRAKSGVYERRLVSAISIGNIVFAAADYEMFSQTGRNVKDAGNENFDLTFMCAYSNGMIGYIPAEYAFENGGYEVNSCKYVKGTAEVIEAKIIELMDELAAK